MALISSISGIRGTIGGPAKDNLNPLNIHDFIFAYANFLYNKKNKQRIKVVIGRDARRSGESIKYLVAAYLMNAGVDVVDLDLISTPSLAMAVTTLKVDGGIMISASHNPKTWNALKFFNQNGEFLNTHDHKRLMNLVVKKNFIYVEEKNLGTYNLDLSLEKNHIEKILALDLVRADLIKKETWKIIVDGINSVGARCIPALLKSLGVKNIVVINNKLDGNFAHNPEPLEKNLQKLKQIVKQEKADLGIAVDPDVDRLSFIAETGKGIGEEYTLSSVADYVLSQVSTQRFNYLQKYNLITVSNLSSSRSLRDLSQKYEAKYEATAVGEANVVKKMKETKAIIGGEGNGGVIFPPLHYGRDALVGVALFLSYLALEQKTVSELRAKFPNYYIIKDKINLDSSFDFKKILLKLKKEYQKNPLIKINELDGLKIDASNYWIHLRSSNTEPIIRIYVEARSRPQAQNLFKEIKDKILANIK